MQNKKLGLLLLILLILLQMVAYAQEEISLLEKSREHIISRFGNPNELSFTDEILSYQNGNYSASFYLRDGRVYQILTVLNVMSLDVAENELKNALLELESSYGWVAEKKGSNYLLGKTDTPKKIICSLHKLTDGTFNLVKTFVTSVYKPQTKPKVEKKSVDVSNENDLNFLKNLNGLYSSDVKLFSNEIFTTRLSRLLGGKRFSFLKKIWNTTPPMQYKNSVFVAEGCQAHNCYLNNAIIVVYLAKDIIHVGICQEGKTTTYSEKGELPSELKRWVQDKNR